MNFIDPFNNVYTIAGQGTIAKEILNQAEKEDNTFDYVFAAIGGGGLISGVSTYFKTHSPLKLSVLNQLVPVVCINQSLSTIV